MPFTVQCTACRSKFALPDAVYEQRIQGKVVELACKHCRASIRVDGTKPRAQHGNESQVNPAEAPEVSPRAAAVVATAESEPSLPSVKPGKRSSTEPGDFPSLKPADADLPSLKPGARTSDPLTRAGLSGRNSRKPAMRVPLPRGASKSSPMSVVGAGASKTAPAAATDPLARTALASPAAHASTSVPLGRTKLVTAAASRPANDSAVSVAATPASLSDASAIPLDDDFDQPTQVIDRRPPPRQPQRTPGNKPPPPRRATGMKATMMGVAPPPSPARAVLSSEESKPVVGTHSGGSGQVASPAVASADVSPLASTVAFSGATALRVGGGRSRLVGGTMLGLAPPPSSASDAAFPAAVSPGIPPEAVEPEAQPSLTGAVLELVDDEDGVSLSEQATAVSGVDATTAVAAGPIDAPVLDGSGEEDSPPTDWDSATSEVSRQIAQSVPNHAPPRRSRGRLMLALLALLVGSAGVVGFLVADGRLQLPPPVQSQVARILPGLTPSAGVSRGAEITSTAPAPAAAERATESQRTEQQGGVSAAVAAHIEAPPAAAADSPSDAPKEDPVTPEQDLAMENPAANEPAANEPAANEPAGLPPTPVMPPAEQPAATAELDPAPVMVAPAGADHFAQPVGNVPDGVNLARAQHLVNLRMKRAANCHRGGRATGNAVVAIKFGADGHTTEVLISGEPIASAPVANCLRTFASSIVIPEFPKGELEMAYAITLR